MKYGKTINIIILMKLLKVTILFLYTAIYVSKWFSFILLFMFPNNTKMYFNFNNIDVLLLITKILGPSPVKGFTGKRIRA